MLNVGNCWGRGAIDEEYWWSDEHDDGFCQAMTDSMKQHVVPVATHRDIRREIEREIEVMCDAKVQILTVCSVARSSPYPALASTSSDLIHLLPPLASAHAGRSDGSPTSARVAVMSGAYGSGRPHPLGWHCRPAMRKNTRKFVDKRSTDVLRIWKVPLHPCTAEPGPTDEEDVLTPDELKAIRQLQTLAKKDRCTVLLYELFTSSDFSGHRAAFVRAFTREAKQLGMVLVLDDTMCSVRCGRFFSYQYYEEVCRPDIVVVGKPWLLSAMILFTDVKGSDLWAGLGGVATAEADWITMRRALHFLRVVRGKNLPGKCAQMGHAVRAYLGAVAVRTAGAIVSGLGAMWHTNLRIKSPLIHRTMQYQRILPTFTTNPDALVTEIEVDESRPPHRKTRS